MRATRVGAGVQAAVQAGGEGVVVAWFPRACYVSLPGGLFATVADGVPIGPLHAVLDSTPVRAHPGAPARAKNVLTRCLGVKPDVKVDVSDSPVVLPDDAVLVMCTDGLSNLVEDGEILHVVAMHLPDGACRRLVQLAKERGGPDNVTVIVARLTRG